MKTNTEPRTVFHTVRVTPTEAAELVEHAEITGLSVSALMRARVLGHPTPCGAAPAINLAAWRELAPTTSNLNHIAYRLNLASKSTEQSGVTLDQVMAAVTEVGGAVKKLRLELIGATSSF